MKKILLILWLFWVPNIAEAKITIFACETQWGSLARMIVKDKADINVAVTADENARTFEATSKVVKQARGAKMIFCSGGDLEQKWLSDLINDSYNLAAISNDNSLLLAANYVVTPQKSWAGKNMPLGSGIHLNPHNITKIAAEFTRRIKMLDQINATFYQRAYEEFAVKWQKEIVKWEKKAAPLKGMSFLANDNSWDYLANWLGFNITTIIDPTTGAKPDFVRLHLVEEQLKTKPVDAIIFASWEDKRAVLKLRDIAKTRTILVPFTTKGPMTLFDLFDRAISALATDCSSGTCKTLIKPESVKVTVQ